MKAVLDLFAGTGVGVACQRLGVKEYGVEIWDSAVRSRQNAGMETPYRDVWDIEEAVDLEFDTLWASPPCQTFSVAGNGSGHRALEDVTSLIASGAWRDMDWLREESKRFTDDRTGLVISPLAYVYRFRPQYVALEQVPTVLPVWRAMAAPLEEMGYSTWVGILDASDYGVPQSRKRAYLIARSDGVTATPPATNPDRMNLSSIRPDQEGLISNYSHNGPENTGIVVPGNKLPRGYRRIHEPAFTATGKVTSQRWYPSMENVTLAEAAQIQSYPENFPFGPDPRLQVGNAVPPKVAEAVLRGFM